MFSTTGTQEWNQNRETIKNDSFWSRLYNAISILFKGDTKSTKPPINTNPTTTAASMFNTNPVSQTNRDYTSTWTNRKTGFTGTTGATGYGGYTSTTGTTGYGGYTGTTGTIGTNGTGYGGYTGTTGATGYGGYTSTGNPYRSTFNSVYNNGFTQMKNPLPYCFLMMLILGMRLPGTTILTELDYQVRYLNEK